MAYVSFDINPFLPLICMAADRALPEAGRGMGGFHPLGIFWLQYSIADAVCQPGTLGTAEGYQSESQSVSPLSQESPLSQS